MSKALTIVVPIYNEEESIPRLGTTLKEYVDATQHQVQVLFVNDGSSDNSQVLLEDVCAKEPSFHFLKLKNNCGLSTAIKAGFDHCEDPYVGYIDADLQTTPMDFDLLLEHVDEFEMVTGVRANRKDTAVKKMSSKIANNIRRSFTNDGATDTGCPLKIFHTKFIQEIPFYDGMHRFFPALVQLAGGKVKEMPVQHFPRIEGESKYHVLNRLWGPMNDLFAFRWMRSRYIRYEIEKEA